MDKTKVWYFARAFITGRQGSQTEESGSKREAIRSAKRMIAEHPFGSAVEVHMVRPGGGETPDSKTLIFQAHIAKRRDGSLYTRSDEL